MSQPEGTVPTEPVQIPPALSPGSACIQTPRAEERDVPGGAREGPRVGDDMDRLIAMEKALAEYDDPRALRLRLRLLRLIAAGPAQLS